MKSGYEKVHLRTLLTVGKYPATLAINFFQFNMRSWSAYRASAVR